MFISAQLTLCVKVQFFYISYLGDDYGDPPPRPPPPYGNHYNSPSQMGGMMGPGGRYSTPPRQILSDTTDDENENPFEVNIVCILMCFTSG